MLKFNYYLKSAFGLAIVLLFSQQVLATELPTDGNPDCKLSEQWEEVKSTNGLTIYYSTITCSDEEFLAIQFKNTTSESLRMKWSLLVDNVGTVITEDEMQEAIIEVKPGESVVFEGTYLVYAKEGDFSSFDVNVESLK